MWTSETQNATETANACLQVNCNGNNYNLGSIEGFELLTANTYIHHRVHEGHREKIGIEHRCNRFNGSSLI